MCIIPCLTSEASIAEAPEALRRFRKPVARVDEKRTGLVQGDDPRTVIDAVAPDVDHVERIDGNHDVDQTRAHVDGAGLRAMPVQCGMLERNVVVVTVERCHPTPEVCQFLALL